MRAFIVYGFCIASAVSAVPVLGQAHDDMMPPTFVALEDVGTSSMEVPLRPFSDDRLAAIEGEGICIACPSIQVGIGVSPITQFNVTNQANFAFGRNISQSAGSNAANRARGTRSWR